MSKPIRIAILADSRGAQAGIGQTETALGRLGRAGERSGKLLKLGLKVGVAGVAALAGSALFKGFGRLKSIDQAQAQLRGLKLDTQEITSVMDSATKAVTGTAFGLDAAASASAGALGAGIKQGKELEGYLTLIGDATTLSTAEFGQMALMMNKVEGSGKLTGEVLNQMAENGLQVMPMLTKEYGKNAVEIQKMVSKGEVSSADFKRILTKNIGGAAQESGKTFSGALANMQASMGRLGAKVLEGSFKRMPAMFESIGSSLDKAGPLAERFGTALGDGISRAMPYVTRMGDSVKDLFSAKTMKGQQSRLDAIRGVAEKTWSAVKKLAGSAADLAKAWKPAVMKTAGTALDGLLKATKGLASILDSVVVPAIGVVGDVLAALPGPLITVGIQAGVAALVFPRLAAGAAAAGTAMRNGATYARVLSLELQDASTRGAMAQTAMAKLGTAARGAAGVAGMVALAQGASSSNTALSSLASVGGGALMGFSVGGPVGAAIGGAAFGLMEIVKHAKSGKDATTQLAKSAEQLKASEAQVQALADSYDSVTGAVTRTTKEQLRNTLISSGQGKALNAIGISTRDAINAQLGHTDAIKRTNQGFRAAEQGLKPYQAELTQAKSVYEAFQAKRTDARTTGAIWSAEDEAGARASADAVKAASGALAGHKAELEEGRNAWTAYTGDAAKGRAEWAASKFDLANLDKSLKAAFPKEGRRSKVSTEIETIGVSPTLAQLTQLQRKYNLTPPQIRTIVRTVGAKASEEVLQRLLATGKLVGSQAPTVKPKVDAKGAKGELNILSAAAKALKDVKVKGPDMRGPVRKAAQAAHGDAARGGTQLGTNLSAGAALGVWAASGQVAAQAAAMVRRALAAANAEAQVRSPSRKTRQLGLYLGAGLVVGLTKSKSKVAKAATSLIAKGTIAAMIKAASDGAGGVTSEITKRLDKSAAKAIKAFNAKHSGKANAKKRAAYEKSVTRAKQAAIKGVKDETRALAVNRAAVTKLMDVGGGRTSAVINANGQLVKGQTRVIQGLTAEREALAQLKQQRLDYIATVRQGFVDHGSLMALGEGDGFGSVDQMLSILEGKESQAKAFEATIEALRVGGLSQTALDQLITAGPEAAMGTAQTLLAGGSQAITAVNRLQANIAASGQRLGTSIANQYFNAGIAAQQGLVNGLESDLARLDKAAKRLAKALVKALRKELQIKSPSRVTRLLGRFTGMGMALGVESEAPAVERAGLKLAKAAEAGVSALAPVIPIRPSLALTGGADGRSGASGLAAPVINVYMHPTSTPAEVGREITKALAAYSESGGTRRAS